MDLYLKCKLYILHIKKIKIKYTVYIYCAIFTHWIPQILHKYIVLQFSYKFYWNFMILKKNRGKRRIGFVMNYTNIYVM
jgi:hypothetical protein